jgi:hypothetical protein
MKRVIQLVQPATDTDPPPLDEPTQLHDVLAIRALTTTIDALRLRARASAWKVMRSAYRELSLEEPYDTQCWLCRSLTLDAAELAEWLVDAEKSNEMKKREGAGTRWILTKVR